MKFKSLFALATSVALALPALAQPVRPPLIDSTGVAKRVASTAQQSLSVNDVTNIAGAVATNIVTNTTNTSGSVPPGYREITTAMSSHYLGSSDTGLAADRKSVV